MELVVVVAITLAISRPRNQRRLCARDLHGRPCDQSGRNNLHVVPCVHCGTDERARSFFRIDLFFFNPAK